MFAGVALYINFLHAHVHNRKICCLMRNNSFHFDVLNTLRFCEIDFSPVIRIIRMVGCLNSFPATGRQTDISRGLYPRILSSFYLLKRKSIESCIMTLNIL